MCTRGGDSPRTRTGHRERHISSCEVQACHVSVDPTVQFEVHTELRQTLQLYQRCAKLTINAQVNLQKQLAHVAALAVSLDGHPVRMYVRDSLPGLSASPLRLLSHLQLSRAVSLLHEAFAAPSAASVCLACSCHPRLLLVSHQLKHTLALLGSSRGAPTRAASCTVVSCWRFPSSSLACCLSRRTPAREEVCKHTAGTAGRTTARATPSSRCRGGAATASRLASQQATAGTLARARPGPRRANASQLGRSSCVRVRCGKGAPLLVEFSLQAACQLGVRLGRAIVSSQINRRSSRGGGGRVGRAGWNGPTIGGAAHGRDTG